MSEVLTGYFQKAQPLDRRSYVSKAKLELALKGLEYFFAAYGEGIFQESTAAQVEGQRLHKAVLEPEEWRRTKFVHRYENFYSSEAKAWKQRVERENPGALIMSPMESLRYDRVVDRIMSHPLAGDLIRRSRTELHGYAKCPRTGALLYSRPDILTPEGWIGDLKFVRNVDEFDFNRAQDRERWHMQLAFYNHVHALLTGQELSGNCFWIAVEPYYPHRLNVFTMKADFEKKGNVYWNLALDKILACLKQDPLMKNFEVWRAHSYRARELEPEPWMVMNDPLVMEQIAVGG